MLAGLNLSYSNVPLKTAWMIAFELFQRVVRTMNGGIEPIDVFESHHAGDEAGSFRADRIEMLPLDA